jgi:uncharacterized protein YjlB
MNNETPNRDEAGAIHALFIRENGPFPNNPHWPLLVYRQALDVSGAHPAADTEELFARNGWTGAWRDGIYTFHHYHSNTHEVLGCYRGSGEILFGGPQGYKLTIQAGDAVVIPAGTAHKRIRASTDFSLVGAYPNGADYDMCYGKPEERPAADSAIASTLAPETDPVFGKHGGLMTHWKTPALAQGRA